MYCRNCGAQLFDNAKFCRECGSAVSVPPGHNRTPSVPAPVPQEMSANNPTAIPVADNTTPPQPSSENTTPAVKPKKRRTGLIIGICAGVFALLLAIVLLAGNYFFDWFNPESGDDNDKKPSSSQHKEDDDIDDNNDVDDDGDEDDSPVEIALNVKEAELVFELTDDDVAAFYELLAVAEELAIEGKNEDAIKDAVEELDDSFVYLQSQHSVAAVLHYCDLEDTDASDLYLSCTETLAEANDEYIKMCRRVYESNSSAKDVFFEEWTELDIKLLMAYTDEVATLIQRNSEIEVEYQQMQDESDMYEAMVPLYIEMVQNNNRIAQIYGYNNYYEYAYEVEYLRDYDPDQVDVMREYVAEYIPDALDLVYERFTENLDNLSSKDYKKIANLLVGSYEDGNKDYIIGYLKTLPKQSRNDMLDMLNGNIIIKDDVKNAMEGAFTTAIGTDRLICFFGPNYNNALTLIHEVGHYYGGCHQYMEDLPLDLAETQSQGNEWLFLAYLEGELSEDIYRVLLDYRLTNDLSLIMVCVIVDEFEQRVYTHPSIDTLTSDDLDAIMEDVCLDYGGIDYLSATFADMREYWRMVVVEQPVYYISYAVSAIAAIDLYNVTGNDYDAAVNIYRDLVENVDLESGFLGNITAAGLSSPFDKEFYQEISNLIKSR